MANMEAYIVAAELGAVQPLSAAPRSEQVRPILDGLLKTSGVSARDVQEFHWHGGEDEYWLNRLGEAQGFSPDMVRFFWPVTPLLPHSIFHLSARAIEAGDRDLIFLGQEHSGNAVALLMASSSAVERYNLSPRVRVGAKLTLNSGADGLLASARKALGHAGQMDRPPLLAASRLISAADGTFPGAQWLLPGPNLPGGDLFLLAGLVIHLDDDQQSRGLLLSSGPQKSGLVTMLEHA